MSKLTEQWIELFRAGKFKPGNSSEEIDFSDSNLAQIARSYRSSKNEAPIVIGHPEQNAPALGWVEKLRVAGGVLFGKLKQIAPQFEQMVEAGLFKKRSIALNKTADGWELRHVGFLGAAPPVIKGLADVVFNDRNEPYVFASEGATMDSGSQDTGQEEQWLTVFCAGDFGADGNYTTDDLDAMVRNHQSKSPDKIPVVVGQFKSDAQPVGMADELQRKGSILRAKVSNLDPKVKQLLDAGVFKKRSAVVEHTPAGFSLTGIGLVEPQWVNGNLNDESTPSLDHLHKTTLGPKNVVFSGDNNLVPNTRRIRVDGDSMRLSAAAYKLASDEGITFSEALGQVAIESDPWKKAIEAKRPAGRLPSDPNSVRLSELTKQRAKDKGISYANALDQIVKEQPELAHSQGAPRGVVRR